MSKNARRYYLYKLLSFIAYLIPMFTLFGIRNETYIVHKSGAGFAFGAVVIMLFAIIAFKHYLLALFKKNAVLTLSITMLVISLILYAMTSPAQELMYISVASILGCILSSVFEKPADIYRNGIVKDGIRIRRETIPHKQAWVDGYLGVSVNGL